MSRGAIIAVLVLTAVALALGSCPSLAVPQVMMKAGYNGPDSLIGGRYGGEFKVYASGWSPPACSHRVTDLYGTDPMDFATFCVQTTEYFSYNTWYDVTFSTSTGGSQQYGIPLDDSAAWLYERFYKGDNTDSALKGYSYYNATQRTTDAFWLQRLIWMYMGYFTETEIGLSSAPDPKYQVWKDNADGQAGTGLHGVEIMQLNVNNQDLLALTVNGSGYPVPEPGSLALLATGALGALPLLRRRRRT